LYKNIPIPQFWQVLVELQSWHLLTWHPMQFPDEAVKLARQLMQLLLILQAKQLGILQDMQLPFKGRNPI
jgi:archaellum biogenesis ATPase FlaH